MAVVKHRQTDGARRKDSRVLAPPELDNRRYGRGKKVSAVIDLRQPNDGVAHAFRIENLFVGKTVVVAPHMDDASLGYGGAISKFARAGGATSKFAASSGNIKIVNVSPGHRAPMFDIPAGHDERKINIRKQEGMKEARILGAGFEYLDLRRLYFERGIFPDEAKKFYQALDRENPTTLVIPGPNDTHPDHQNVRFLSLNWAADQARKGNPKVIVEAPSVWGSIPEKYLTHILRLDRKTLRARERAQRVHKSQNTRTDFSKASRLKAMAHGVVAGELVHGLVQKTPDLGETEIYSQHIIICQGKNVVFKRLDKETLAQLRNH